MSPRAYDLVGDIALPAEVFPRLEALGKMADTLAAAGHTEAAAETRHFLDEARTFAALTETRLGRLRPVWKSVEMGESRNPGSRR